jgi:hypothetical protein
MNPIPVSDYDLVHGLQDGAKYRPNLSLPKGDFGEAAREFFYGNINIGTHAFNLRDHALTDPELAYRHLCALRVSKNLTPQSRIDGIARLMNQWYSTIEVRVGDKVT